MENVLLKIDIYSRSCLARDIIVIFREWNERRLMTVFMNDEEVEQRERIERSMILFCFFFGIVSRVEIFENSIDSSRVFIDWHLILFVVERRMNFHLIMVRLFVLVFFFLICL